VTGSPVICGRQLSLPSSGASAQKLLISQWPSPPSADGTQVWYLGSALPQSLVSVQVWPVWHIPSFPLHVWPDGHGFSLLSHFLGQMRPWRQSCCRVQG